MKDLSLHILDIVQNSITAGGRNIFVNISEQSQSDTCTISISDDGCGMSPEVLQRVTDPFYTSRTTRKVGMGIPLFKQNAEQSGGSLQIESQKGKGTRVVAVFGLNHIDRPPLGDIAGVITILCGSNPRIRFCYTHIIDSERYVFDTEEVNQALDGLEINQPQVLRYLKQMIQENLAHMKAL